MRLRTGAAVLLALAVATLGVAGGATVPPSPAGAADDFSAAGPLWYLEAMKIPPIHDSGITGEGVTIAVIDGAINPAVANLQDADIEIRQLEGCPDPADVETTDFEALRHGTSATSLIVGNSTADGGAGPAGIAPHAKILYYGLLQEGCEARYVDALDDAAAEGADIVTMSGGFLQVNDQLSQEVADSVAEAMRSGVLVVAALPNWDSLGTAQLTFINGVINVAAVDGAARPLTRLDGTDMTNDDVDVVAPGVDVAGLGHDGTWGMSTWSGNSAATPIVAGLLALAKQKWPDATASQLTQSLIRNTGSQPHELQWSSRLGHGVVNATRLLAEDATQYPDENPLFKDEQNPSFDEVYAAPPPTAAPSSSEDSDESLLPWGIAGVVVVIAVIALVLVVASRKKTRGRSSV
ncbi:hypothetical protein CW368_05490 [Actinomycetales bacterium SN12]|nr:hypothetical protein CW368_05490 [Actinomycetales bacterium SN12]